MIVRPNLTSAIGVVLSLALLACGSSQEEPDVPDYPTQPPAAYTAPQAYTGAPQPTYNPPPVVAPPPPSEQECRARAASVPRVDTAGSADVRQQFGKVFDAYHETFRCCFDALEAPSKPRVDAKISLVVKVDVGGKLTSAEVMAAESSPIYPQTAKCITDIASMIAYPQPVNAQPVAYGRMFDFRARW